MKGAAYDLGLSTQATETDLPDLPVQGKVPQWRRGSFEKSIDECASSGDASRLTQAWLTSPRPGSSAVAVPLVAPARAQDPAVACTRSRGARTMPVKRQLRHELLGT